MSTDIAQAEDVEAIDTGTGSYTALGRLEF